ncbi:Furin [Fasciola hepatica]|uniref:Furin n=1 Tax=Fasciola hepatica TaxID=6192 RepID=A0A4E0RKD3_FASHE|nr:Furin [Fasciola hepatica]
MILWPMMLSGPLYSTKQFLSWSPCLTILNLLIVLRSNTIGIPLHETSKENSPTEIDPVMFYDTSSEKKPIFTPFWAVELQGGEEAAREIANKYGFTYIGEIMPGIYHFKQSRLSKRSIYHSIYYHDQLVEDPKVLWAEQQVVKTRVKRDVHIPVNDPHWPHMWYLNRGGSGGLDMNVRSAWARGYAGQDVVVTILDDGLETDHPDLKENYDPFASYDVNGNDDNPEPRYHDKVTASNRHGTRCAGEVAAVANNSLCGLGIAYRARIGGVRMLDGDVSDAMESRSLGHQLQHIDVYSASWGPEDDGKTVDGPGRLAQLAFRNGIQMGRGGLGSIFVWASGNGGKSGDNCNCDGYTNSIYTLGVSSASEHGSVPWYAEMCSSTLTVTYSSGGHGERGVITTDLNHTCTNNHSGTSASAPLAAGICAVTLSANPRLTWRDLQYLVVYTARPDGLYADDWRVNGVGRRVSHAFGYGLMDAGAMVDLALNWTNVPPQRVCEAQAPITGGPVSVRPMSRENLALTTDGCASAAARAGDPSQRVVYLEHVQAKVTVSSAQRGEIELWLTSPSGTVSKLLSKRPKDIEVAGFHAWPFMSVHYWGELANGTWKLTVHSGKAAVSIHDWILILYGTNTPPPMHDASHRRGVRQLPKAEIRHADISNADPIEPANRFSSSFSSASKEVDGARHSTPKVNPSHKLNVTSASEGQAPPSPPPRSSAAVGKSQSSYPGYPFYYYPNGLGAYGFWPMWNQDAQNPAPYLPPSASSSTLSQAAGNHVPIHSAAAPAAGPPPPPPPIASRLYAHLFPPNVHGLDEHHSPDPDTSVRHGSIDDPRPPNPFMDDPNPLFDLDLPPILGSVSDNGDTNPNVMDGSSSSLVTSRLDGMSSRTGSLRPSVSLPLSSAAPMRSYSLLRRWTVLFVSWLSVSPF